MAALREGDRVRVEFEGVVVVPEDSDGDVMVKVEGSNFNRWCSPDEATVIERAFKAGDLVIDADDDVFRFTPSGGWARPGQAHSWHFEYPTRPLKRLVPES